MPPIDAADLSYRLLGLPMAGAVLHVGAHPDDEDGGLLAQLARGLGVRAVYWSATRGEGGQNRLNGYRDEALGVFRTWESEAARAVGGGECLFGPFYDFGYSKSASDTLRRWGADAVVREIVRAIRMVQPQVVVCRWTGSAADEHGHHQAVGQAMLDAFAAAGDPERFPELRRQGLAAWQPLRLLQSIGGDWTPEQDVARLMGTEADVDGAVRVDAGRPDPVRGRTFQEQAWAALNEHRTQAMAMLPAPGPFTYAYRRVVDRAPGGTPGDGFFDGLDPSLTGLADHPGADSPWLRARLAEIKEETEQALADFHVLSPEGAGRRLLSAASLLRAAADGLVDRGEIDAQAGAALGRYLRRKLDDVEQAAARCLGLRLDCVASEERVIPGGSMTVAVGLWASAPVAVRVLSADLAVPPGWSVQPREEPAGDADGRVAGAIFAVGVGSDAALSCPYWLAEPRGPYAYRWPDGDPCGRPFAPPPVTAECRVAVDGQTLALRAPALARSGVPGGVRERPPLVIPPVSLRPRPRAAFARAADGGSHAPALPPSFQPAPAGETRLTLEVVVRNHSGEPVDGRLVPEGPPDVHWEPARRALVLGPGESCRVGFAVTVPPGRPAGQHLLRYRMDAGGRAYSVSVTPVRAGTDGRADAATCLREEIVLAPAEVELHVIDARFPRGLRYAYVSGLAENVVAALRPFGVSFDELGDQDLAHVDLAGFDAIVVGPCAYSMRDAVRASAPRLLDYVAGGGTLVVQYQPYRYETPGLAPYPLRYHQPHDRVTDPGAPVELLDRSHPLFTVPNAVGHADFEGWVRDRGLYFFGEWDRRYTALVACADPGEEPRHGGLLVAQHGRGTYVYCGLSLFRQLGAGVPGAFRLFANLLALPAARLAERIAFMQGTDVFGSLPDTQLESLARIVSERVVEDGTVIARQGDMAREVYLVREGKVAITRHRGDGRAERLHTSGEGECIGEVAALGQLPRTASMVADGPVRLLVMDHAELDGLLESRPDISRALITLLAGRVAAEAGLWR